MNASPVFRMWGGEAHLAANLHFEGIHIGFRDQNPLLCLSASRHLSCQHFRAVHLHACTHAPVSARVCACMHVRVRMHVCVCVRVRVAFRRGCRVPTGLADFGVKRQRHPAPLAMGQERAPSV